MIISIIIFTHQLNHLDIHINPNHIYNSLKLRTNFYKNHMINHIYKFAH